MLALQALGWGQAHPPGGRLQLQPHYGARVLATGRQNGGLMHPEPC